MIKTVVLSGAEQRVDGLDGQNTVIVNFGSSALYVSSKPDIIPDGDNVVTIFPGSATNLYDTNGTVYLLGTGKVQLEGTNYNTVPIIGGTSSGGGGVIPTAETMPIMDGITGYFVPEDIDTQSDVWINTVKIYPSIKLSGVTKKNGFAHFPAAAGLGELITDEPNTVYCVLKFSNVSSTEEFWLMGITKALANSTGILTYAFDLFDHDGFYAFSAIGSDIDSDISVEQFAVCVYTRTSNTAIFYVNGTQINSAEANTGKYGGKMLIHGQKRGTNVINIPDTGDVDMCMCAFGSTAHTAEQIKANSEWLMNKYPGGG